jgi:hypothetical protein
VRPITRRGRVIAVAVVAFLAVPAIAIANHFTDVPAGFVHKPGIDYLESTGITAGCTPTTFCPNDGLTRGQMGSFIFRSSGNAPGIDPSVNAAQLDGEGPEAYTTSVYLATLSGGSLAANTSSGTAAQTGLITGLPAGEYVISGQVYASGGTSSRLVCRTLVDGTQVARSIGRVGSDAGQASQLTMPVTAHAVVPGGSANLELRCHAENVAAGAPSISDSDLTRVMATRIGNAP